MDRSVINLEKEKEKINKLLKVKENIEKLHKREEDKMITMYRKSEKREK